MRPSLVILAILLTTSVTAQDLGNSEPPRTFTQHQAPAVDPEVIRQGGDTWEDAVTIPGIPHETTGTTVGYSANCCVEDCPYEAFGPAVFYRLVPDMDIDVRIDLCGSDFDTGLYVFNADHGVVACNLAYYDGPPCGQWVSCLESVALAAGEPYTIVISGMSNASGNYTLEISEFTPCVIDLPGNAVYEGEPSLEDDYVDAYNGGCNSPDQGAPFQALQGDAEGNLVFAGRAGWYYSGYDPKRDTDWFTAVLGPTGTLEITAQFEIRSYFFELGPQDCEPVAVLQSLHLQPCDEGTMVVTGEPGSTVWLWAGSYSFMAPNWYPANEYNYLLTMSGLQSGPVRVEQHSWSGVKSLYR